jgi:hypothetical protein
MSDFVVEGRFSDVRRNPAVRNDNGIYISSKYNVPYANRRVGIGRFI